ncbi:MAG: 2-dehydropantoate 2-reductase [Pseudomonadota bacterium]|nr:2-dehydropantoate 2-reductase [Pseudomonadota bacterium]
MAKRILIMGAGAVGSYVGGYMARMGEDVIFVDPWPEHVSTINNNGLTLEGLTTEECFNTPARAISLTEVQSLAREAPIDIAFICVKSYDTAWATMLIKDYLSPTGFCVSLQNCINEETIASIVGWGRTTGCIAAKIAVELTGPGVVRRGVPLGGKKHTVFRAGEVHGRVTPRIEEIVRLLSAVDSAKVTSNLWGERWSKLVANAMRNGICAATGMGANECDKETITRRLSIRLAGEAVKIGQALGYELETINKFAPNEWVKAMDGDEEMINNMENTMEESAVGRSDASRPSMAQDIAKKRRTEIHAINGFVVEKANEIGLDAPVNKKLVDAVHQVETGAKNQSLDLVASI